MKKVFAIVVLLVCFFQVNAQTVPALVWSRSMGGSARESGYSIIPTGDGGTLSASNSNSVNGDVNGVHGTSGWFDFWLIKQDSSGNVQWTKALGGTSTDICYDMCSTADGGYVLCGYAISNDGDISGNHGGTADAWAVKVDNGGNIVWQKCYGGTALDRFRDVTPTSDGGFAFIGSTLSIDGDVSGQHNAANTDVWVVKTDSVGTLQWQRCIGGTNYDDGYGIVQMKDNTFWLTGEIWSADFDGVGNHGYYDYLVMHLDTVGVTLQRKIYGGYDQEFARGILKTNDNNVVVYGMGSSASGNVIGAIGSYDYWILKLDSVGGIIWQKCLGGTGSDGAYDAKQTADNGFVFSGYSASNDVMVSGNHGGNDAWIVKTDSVGNFEWQKSFGGTADDECWAVAVNDDNTVVVGVNTLSANGNIVNSHGGPDEFWIGKLSSNYNVISGTVYADLNNNLVQDTFEFGLSNHLVSEMASQQQTFTDANGKYEIMVFDSGLFTIVTDTLIYFGPHPQTQTAVFTTASGNVDSLLNFAMQCPFPPLYDLSMTMNPITAFRHGFPAYLSVEIANYANMWQPATITIYNDTGFVFDSVYAALGVVSPDSIVIAVDSIAPLTKRTYIVIGSVDVNAVLGSTINLAGRIDIPESDANYSNNVDTLSTMITGSFDPNDISANFSEIKEPYVASRPEIEFLIRFQNTGNDTAFNIVVLDTLSPYLDPSTLQFKNASHLVKMDYIDNQRLLKFSFNNILLADSNTNELLSHGYVSFAVKAFDNLQYPQVISSAANIYFDFNSAVRTNDWDIVISRITGLQEVQHSSFLVVYPNPAKDQTTLIMPKGVMAEQVVVKSLLGETVTEIQHLAQSMVSIPLANLIPGIYLVQVYSNNKMYSTKIIKQ